MCFFTVIFDFCFQFLQKFIIAGEVSVRCFPGFGLLKGHHQDIKPTLGAFCLVHLERFSWVIGPIFGIFSDPKSNLWSMIHASTPFVVSLPGTQCVEYFGDSFRICPNFGDYFTLQL